MALDAIIFDVDGTLVDTNALHIAAWKTALAGHGFAIPEDRIAPEIGKGGDNLLPALIGQAATDEYKEALSDACSEEFLKLVEQKPVEIFPGVRELFAELKQRGLKIAIATSAESEAFGAIQKSAGLDLEELADAIVTSSDAENSKPAPDIVLAAVKKLGLSPAQCAMIGDTIHDAEACRHAGVACIGVKTGGNAENDLRSSGARVVYDDIAALLKNLNDASKIASPGTAHLSGDVLQKLMREALEVAREGMRNGEAPIGCVLADGNAQIIARGYNEMQGSQNKTAHAEIVTFARAAGKTPLEARDLVLVSTLEPCVMCTGAAMEAAVDTIVYALRAPLDSGTGRVRAPQSPESQMPRIVSDVLADESRSLFEEWLKKNADSSQAAFIKQLLAATEGS
ncbi:MAG TPA: HAD-IA family hydrolase [Abditibacteriaceae bacterium]|jgi:HAD superfamily hydrolase (TIGR01509 family)